jgi:hypothetical protein
LGEENLVNRPKTRADDKAQPRVQLQTSFKF